MVQSNNFRLRFASASKAYFYLFEPIGVKVSLEERYEAFRSVKSVIEQKLVKVFFYGGFLVSFKEENIEERLFAPYKEGAQS